MKLRAKWVIAANLGMTSLICFACILGGCGIGQDYYERLMRRDPGDMSDGDLAEVERLLLSGIQDGYGRRLKTPRGETYLDYYMRVLQTLPLDSSSSLIHLRSCTGMPAQRWGNAGEAVVQEGYGQRACEAILATARRWVTDWTASRYAPNVVAQKIGFAGSFVKRTPFRY